MMNTLELYLNFKAIAMAITHTVIHTDLYYVTINNRLLRASNVSRELSLIRTEILNGSFPYK